MLNALASKHLIKGIRSNTFGFSQAVDDVLSHLSMKPSVYETILTSIRSRPNHILVAIDGRACSGKTTLATRLAQDVSAARFNLDDLFIPFKKQPSTMKPGFPFPYFRYAEFLDGIRTLRKGKAFHYFPYDWHLDANSSNQNCIEPRKVTIVEGVSSMNVEASDLFDLKIFVVSDQQSQMKAAMERDGEKFERFWIDQWLPSEEAYFSQKPWTRADFLYAGRGVEIESISQHLEIESAALF